MFIRRITTEAVVILIDIIIHTIDIMLPIIVTVEAIIMRMFITTIIGAVTITIGEIISIIMGDDVITFITHVVSFGVT